MTKSLESDADLFIAALSQTPVSVWQPDANGVYCEVDRGIIDKFTEKSVRLNTKTDEIAYYFRDDGTLFRAET
ncbi:hypothetical protein [Paenibacillus alba]|uniref:Uncharacterized protein n=1 Tax=Paenibacillus alba TaxID=1197127 RepID=A0ABU6GCJ0_9BACL|nr:hypothetical protein [Paenibacillus alba]MEC0231922.1 hypothetical protein [Paenibacillus alba]NQX66261.1 hypothetical protein [Paenibacillus alba]